MKRRLLNTFPIIKSILLGHEPVVLGMRKSWFSCLTEAGQPTHVSHPHLLKPGEVLPGLHKNEFHARRELCLKILQDLSDEDHLIIVPSATKQYMTYNVPYPFRQNTDFLYLTGCQASDSVLTLSVDDGVVLFLRQRDASELLWDGPCTKVEDAPSLFGIDDVRPLSEFGSYLDEFPLDNRPLKMWFDTAQPCGKEVRAAVEAWAKSRNRSTHVSARAFLGWHRRPSPPPSPSRDASCRQAWNLPAGLTHSVRVVKTDSEVALMRTACRIASEAIEACMRRSRAGIGEHELYATVDFESRLRGANFLAYPPVVAGGARANIVHYLSNDQLVRDGELVLMDAGCEYYGYCSDITRTWPVNGKFSPAQKIIYQIVLEVQKDLLDACFEFPTLDELHRKMIVNIGEKLVSSGVIKSDESMPHLIKLGNKYCPHHVSHYLGMDVHDCAFINRNIDVRPGMIITLEPGIYIRPDDSEVRPEFRGISVRIEDDVLITEEGPDILTKGCPKEISDIEEVIKNDKTCI